MTRPTKEQCAGALFAALVGDALGVPYEFNRKKDLPPIDQIEMAPPKNFFRSHRATPVGTWSDDGALMLALLDSLGNVPEFDVNDFARNMVSWLRTGAYTPDARVFDIGMQTRAALERIAKGTPALAAAERSERNNGNGSLMRVLPVAFLAGSNEDIVRIAKLQSRPTHAEPRSELTCALYALLVRKLLNKVPPELALSNAFSTLYSLTPPSEQPELIQFLGQKPSEVTGSGYVVDCFWSAWECFITTGNVEACLKAAVALGDDTDTTACVAGGLAGAYYGRQDIPARWIEALRGKELVERLLAKL